MGLRITMRPTAAGIVMNETIRVENPSVVFNPGMSPAAACRDIPGSIAVATAMA